MLVLRPGLSFCVVDDLVVFLDVQRDRYFRLSPPLSKVFLELSTQAAAGCAFDAGRAHPFVERGILVDGGQSMASWISAPSACPVHDWRAEGRPKLTYTLLAWVCILATLLKLRARSFESLINDTERRRGLERAQLPEGAIESFRFAQRHFLRHLDCLPAALSLHVYLDALSVPSQLVLAVTLKPFAAHCWIQRDGTVISDTVEHVRDYTPIRCVP